MKVLRKFHKMIIDYVYDSSINIKDRTFILFSCAVLFALYTAIPCGLIMREPISATIATVIGAIFFTAYVVYSFKKETIHRARIVISFILVFIFLPSMFFTNGGVEGGAPIWILLGTFYIAMILEGAFKNVMIGCEAITLALCWAVGYYFPDLVTQYTRGGNYFDTIVGLIVVSIVVYMMVEFYSRILGHEEESKNVQRLFAQTATALVNAIDAKDKYTHGHSARVAEYSKKIAEEAGKSPSECEEIYYVALLHDVGKIGVPIAIINKDGRLTDEEYDMIKQHPSMGAQILQGITEYPYMSIGAHFHHERFDGKGYPSGMKGTDIPEVARIIAVADAYDAMTSKRSYRDPIPKDQVRQEFIEGAGAQFDPKFANIMLHLMDLDTEYEMKERTESKSINDKDEIVIGGYRDEVSEGIHISQNMTTIDLKVGSDKQGAGHTPKPSLVIFDSLDGRFHDSEKEVKDLNYFEYCEIRFDGRVISIDGARKSETNEVGEGDASLGAGKYRIEAVRVKDHVLIRFINNEKTVETVVALPDSTRFAYMGLTGEHCRLHGLNIVKSEEEVSTDYITRIAEEISYINVPAGDVPNVQVDGYRTDSTDGIPIRDGMTLTFHSVSLPTAWLVWHCPSYVVFSSDDGKVNGNAYTEYSLVRLDGENWEAGEVADNKIVVNRDDFNGWDSWKKYNSDGFECSVTFKRDGNKIISQTENDGISIKNILEVKVETDELYVALSGDQVALTNIRITTESEKGENDV